MPYAINPSESSAPENVRNLLDAAHAALLSSPPGEKAAEAVAHLSAVQQLLCLSEGVSPVLAEEYQREFHLLESLFDRGQSYYAERRRIREAAGLGVPDRVTTLSLEG
jgi:hypothetical protein